MGHIQRVKIERNELADKVGALHVFIYADNGVFDNLDKDERVRLSQQLALMNGYLKVLNERLCAASQK